MPGVRTSPRWGGTKFLPSFIVTTTIDRAISLTNSSKELLMSTWPDNRGWHRGQCPGSRHQHKCTSGSRSTAIPSHPLVAKEPRVPRLNARSSPFMQRNRTLARHKRAVLSIHPSRTMQILSFCVCHFSALLYINRFACAYSCFLLTLRSDELLTC